MARKTSLGYSCGIQTHADQRTHLTQRSADKCRAKHRNRSKKEGKLKARHRYET